MDNNYNSSDKISIDIPLFIRLLEYAAREDAKTDMDLHKVAENAISLSTSGQTLTMGDYNDIIKINELQERLQYMAGIIK